MNPTPKEIYYSFDCINGRLYEPSSNFTWSPHNPDYDPGPPPPPQLPKPPKASDVTVIETSSADHSGPQSAGPSGSPSKRGGSRRRGRGRGRTIPESSLFLPQTQPWSRRPPAEHRHQYSGQPRFLPEFQPPFSLETQPWSRRSPAEHQPRYPGQPMFFPESQPLYSPQTQPWIPPHARYPSQPIPHPQTRTPAGFTPDTRNTQFRPRRGRGGSSAVRDEAQFD